MRITSTTFATCALFALAGCERQSVEQRQAEEQRELAAEQAEERQELTQEQIDEQRRAQQRAAEQLRGETEDLREERQDVAQEAREVSTLLASACQGVAEANFDKCPIDARNVTSVRDIDDGVEIQMSAIAGSERELQRHVSCYEARHELRAAGVSVPMASGTIAGTTPGTTQPQVPQQQQQQPGQQAQGQQQPMACMLDFANIDVDVDDGDNGRIEVEITSDDENRVNELRARAHQLTQRQASLR